ncbi:MAG: hypothetical protein K9J16_06350 [Melioribacteraceae bacterium]|nr:hypothetical protein [Melioribacteraceae bacterium]MCF8394113.1 hypothetical protein [Melioribacteraceae bacterium]
MQPAKKTAGKFFSFVFYKSCSLNLFIFVSSSAVLARKVKQGNSSKHFLIIKRGMNKMKIRNLGYLGLLGSLGVLGTIMDNSALFGLFGLFGFYGFFGYQDDNHNTKK